MPESSRVHAPNVPLPWQSPDAGSRHHGTEPQSASVLTRRRGANKAEKKKLREEYPAGGGRCDCRGTLRARDKGNLRNGRADCGARRGELPWRHRWF